MRTGVILGLIFGLGLSFPLKGKSQTPAGEATSQSDIGPPAQGLTEEERAFREANMPGNKRITWELRRQVPFVRNGGVLNRKETAVVGYVDGELWPPAIMVGIQRGLMYWLTVGLDVGGDYGVFQALIRIKQEMARARRTNSFFWGWHIRTGYKYVNVDFTDKDPVLLFQDNSWILTFENTFAYRFGKHRRRALYLNTAIYGDFDLRGNGWQTDAYIMPAIGFETVISSHWNFYVEGGVIISLNGWETDQGVMSENGDVFPSATVGFAYRWGGVRTALPKNWRDPADVPIR